MLFETKLVYPGSKFPNGNWQPENFAFETIEFQSGDGTKLVGWYLPARQASIEQTSDGEPADPTNTQTVLLCHGNGENAAQSSAYIGDQLRRHLNADVFVFDYRGYGKSEGVPYEAGVLADATAAYQWLQQKSGKQAGEIILVGHSIGGGPAVHLASQFGCKALVLQRTFNSLAAAAQSRYWWLPVRFVIRNPYRSDQKILNCPQPLLQSHGTGDEIIPIELARALFEASPAKNKKFIAHEGGGHLTPLPESYWQTLREFVAGL